ncbi:hypothetical protein NQT62_04925 [Limnobacter humi]|uniref:Uncharacterized protein n=1 Tax=Limnobacter humi TaxID=1778671 RepID=A0ABT1WE28_9BURK|nr:hypothetical protein [Limnobacter humi]MCQ8895785.1 hypothetical protein [Limnobacter humi]
MSEGSRAVLCDCEKLRECKSFDGWKDFDSFVELLNKAGVVSTTPVITPYFNVGLSENWYRCEKCQRVWRLVEPDPPFSGLWERVA